MILEILSWVTFGFLGLRFGVLLINVLTRPVLLRADAAHSEMVSVLIPARNEAENLPGTLEKLLELEHENLEVIVLDDNSEDGTSDVVEDFGRQWPDFRLRLLSGKPLPKGWLGKNWACHQLAEAATGDFFLFIDADVQLSPSAVRSAIAEQKSKQLDLLSTFPTQVMLSLGEKISVPLMHWVLLSLLPLRLVLGSRMTAFSAANGQFMFFRANSYRQHGWHERVKGIVVEDIAIMQAVKESGLKGEVLLGGTEVACRMYGNYEEARQGFAKNFLAIFGGSIAGLVVFIWLSVLSYPILALSGVSLAGIPLWSIVLAVLFVYKILLARLSDQCVQESVYLHPLQMLAFVHISIGSIYRKLTKTNSWKGRAVDIS